MSQSIPRLADGGIYRDFEQELLESLQQHGAMMHGCPLWKVECKLDGSLAIWFKGPRDGIEWSGALRPNFVYLKDKHLLGDTNACTEMCLQMLEDIRRRGSMPLIQRAQAN